ncbi:MULTISPECIES: sensor domain-containing diguanylate cyclase [Halomonas]|uniref:diguanylate cyclase n=1 Tax=Halomonas chromatireducens TaxID=507626 RepID=A0A0X8HDG3_9GAMM|nr:MULTISPECIES: sensor domain-containing diguanylate cyclase [Halomonas]AMD00612.1 putative diguanylate cyclase YeaP [Halomonas chromatireducens]
MSMPPQGLPSGELLDQLARAVTDNDDLESLVRPLLELLQAVTELESTYLTTIDPDERFQHIQFAYNPHGLTIPEGLSVPWSDTLCKRALDEGRAYTDTVAECWADSGAARQLGLVTYLSAPVRVGDSELYGTLCGASASRVAVTAEAERLLGLFANLIARQIERDRLLQKLRQENSLFSSYALTDPLTGIPNRRALYHELSRSLANAARYGEALYIAFIDLDGFKAINDQYGHDAGDRFLISMTSVLTKGLRTGDYLARTGGDEFVFFGLGSRADTADKDEDVLHHRLESLTTGRFDIGYQSIEYPGASVGLIRAGNGERDIDGLLKRADAAMYVVKRARRSRRQF